MSNYMAVLKNIWHMKNIWQSEEMDRFLEKFSLPRLNQEETGTTNNPVTSTEIETMIKNLPKKQKPRARWLHR